MYVHTWLHTFTYTDIHKYMHMNAYMMRLQHLIHIDMFKSGISMDNGCMEYICIYLTFFFYFPAMASTPLA